MNAKPCVALFAVLAVVLMQNCVVAQDATTSGNAVGSRANSLVVAAPVYRERYTEHFSSTNAEGLGRGLGAFASGIGEMNLYNSMAAANLEESRRRAIENRRLAVENYFAMRRINAEYRESQLHRKGSMIYTGQASERARPTANQIDDLTGAIQWPKPLQGRAYSSSRKQLELQFAHLTETRSRQSAFARQRVQQVTRGMKEQLKTEIRQMSPSDYVTAKKFIDGLADEYESRLARRSERLAAR
jgi:hypothetical protein